jgi:hypothetical protein
MSSSIEFNPATMNPAAIILPQINNTNNTNIMNNFDNIIIVILLIIIIYMIIKNNILTHK